MHDLSPVVFRGESNGQLKSEGGYLHPFFFAEDFQQAKLYAGHTEPLACVINGDSFIDLTALDHANPVHQRLVGLLAAQFDDWTCRFSGEPRDAWSFVEAGDLYDYEGNGSGERWRTLLNILLDEYDAVRVLDCTDGTGGAAVPVWVTRERESIRMATVGEKLQALLEQRPWAEVKEWLQGEHSGLLDRVSRLRSKDPAFQLSCLDKCPPAASRQPVAYRGGPVTVWRALPEGGDIRPGDWVTLDRRYAAAHAEAKGFVLRSLELVAPDDVCWDGTDEHEFSYLPAAWSLESDSTEQYLRELGPERLRMLCDGEMSSITRLDAQVSELQRHIVSNFDAAALGDYHGQDHWRRVASHASAVARSLGIDPLVPTVFAWVHDSQRWDEAEDPEHGRRAAAFVRAHRADLFGFLSDTEVDLLARACEVHSDGTVESEPILQACLDADRLDLWRVGIEPSPELLATAYAKDASSIDHAYYYWLSTEVRSYEDAAVPPEPVSA